MIFKKFSVIISCKTVLLMATLFALGYFIATPGYHATTLITAVLLISQCLLLYRFVIKTNTELTRFLEAARHADFSQHFSYTNLGAGFDELGQTFTNILKKLQEDRIKQAEELCHLKAIIEHAPVPLISLHSQGKVTLWNNSARRLFGSNSVHLANDLPQFGEEFAQQVHALPANERRLVSFSADDMEQQLTISATQITIAGKQEKLISMQNIKNELDGMQLQAWQDLVSVLTHEIMNSITPVASLAKTAVVLLDDVSDNICNINELKQAQLTELRTDLADVNDAVQTVARRSDGLMEFIGSYRRLTNLPVLNKKAINVADLFKQVTNIATQHWQQHNIQLQLEVSPTTLSVTIDIHMVEQILINLLQNAEHALEQVAAPIVRLHAYLNKRGHVVIDIADNGDGVADEIAKNIFVPFFTTKRNGSGVGLALARQVMLAHHGMIKLEQSPTGGALFRLTF